MVFKPTLLNLVVIGLNLGQEEGEHTPFCARTLRASSRNRAARIAVGFKQNSDLPCRTEATSRPCRSASAQ